MKKRKLKIIASVILTLTVFASALSTVSYAEQSTPLDVDEFGIYTQNGEQTTGDVQDTFMFDVNKGLLQGSNIVSLGEVNLGNHKPIIYNSASFDTGAYYAIQYPTDERVSFSLYSSYWNEGADVYRVKTTITPQGDTYWLKIEENGVIFESREIPQTYIYGIGVLTWSTDSNLFYRVDTFGTPYGDNSNYFQSDIRMMNVICDGWTAPSAQTQFSFGLENEFYPLCFDLVAYNRSDWLNSVYDYETLFEKNRVYQLHYTWLTGHLSQSRYENGYNDGLYIGTENGYNSGYSTGYSQAETDLHEQMKQNSDKSYNLGYLDGKDDGYMQGLNASSSLKEALDKIGYYTMKGITLFSENGTIFGEQLSDIVATFVAAVAALWFVKKVT